MRFCCENIKAYCDEVYVDGKHEIMGWPLTQEQVDKYAEACYECYVQRNPKDKNTQSEEINKKYGGSFLSRLALLISDE